MKKEDYTKRVTEIDALMLQLNQERQSIKTQYIQENREFSDGQKVEITTREHPYWTIKSGKEIAGTIPEKKRFAFVVGYEIDSKKDLKPLLKKCKKDGTMSQNNDYLNSQLDIIKSA